MYRLYLSDESWSNDTPPPQSLRKRSESSSKVQRLAASNLVYPSFLRCWRGRDASIAPCASSDVGVAIDVVVALAVFMNKVTTLSIAAALPELADLG
jgi:hypothetical protein